MAAPNESERGADSAGVLSASTLAALWADLEREPTSGDLVLAAPTPRPMTRRIQTQDQDPVADHVAAELGPTGTLLFLVPGRASGADLAAWRNALWPAVHIIAHYSAGADGLARRTLGGTQRLAGCPTLPGTVLVGRPRALVLSPEATVEKFDSNAAGWSGDPASTGYGHHRWMRRFVGLFAPLPAAGSAGQPLRILDFGCGGGWVGIEAALAAQAAQMTQAARPSAAVELCSFDPSPEMVRLTEENALAAGVKCFSGRTGFGHAPPFPAAGEAPFDLVLSSGVASFAPDAEAWFDGLCACLRPGGTLVVGDIERRAAGMRRRRSQKPLLPVRELNALSRSRARLLLERHGLTITDAAGYQLTRPIPELMHLSETRLGGLLAKPLLLLNRLAASSNRGLGLPPQAAFDSWVIAAKSSA
ncbi:MAG: hypothetical protein CMJ87_12025 [Planctomycetes bacterium]|nr:hypothetical protein [Planctomycetota bacterium]